LCQHRPVSWHERVLQDGPKGPSGAAHGQGKRPVQRRRRATTAKLPRCPGSAPERGSNSSTTEHTGIGPAREGPRKQQRRQQRHQQRRQQQRHQQRRKQVKGEYNHPPHKNGRGRTRPGAMSPRRPALSSRSPVLLRSKPTESGLGETRSHPLQQAHYSACWGGRGGRRDGGSSSEGGKTKTGPGRTRPGARLPRRTVNSVSSATTSQTEEGGWGGLSSVFRRPSP